MSLTDEINKLKQEKNAIILVHNYQRIELDPIADLIGDSLELSRKAAQTDKDIIVFCGVHFMAETAKILNPTKTVLLPRRDAGCFMADMIEAHDVIQMRNQYPDAAVACYINTTAEVKAYSDICVTSANAVNVINSLEQQRVIFLPDKNLAAYVQQHTTKTIIPYNGFCPVHHRMDAKILQMAKEVHPDAKVIAHPECTQEVLALADYICSTSKMMKIPQESTANKFLIATEVEVVKRLQKAYPDKEFYSGVMGNVCKNMKKTGEQDVYDALQQLQYKIELNEDLRLKAKTCIERMLNVAN
jgi:quinolinate synthase